MKKEWSIKDNWRAHISNYILSKRKKKSSFSTEDYCKQEGIDHEAFNAWLKHIEREDRYTFYTSFASEYINRAKRSLDLIEKHINVSELRMPLMRDVIIAYAAPFTKKNYGRLSNKFSLNNIENIVPDAFQATHKKICNDRDQIVAHCDLGPRNPRVSLIGTSIRMAGYYWKDYQALVPDIKILISIVQENLKKYNQVNFTPLETYFQESINSPKSAEQDPGPPSANKIYSEKTD